MKTIEKKNSVQLLEQTMDASEKNQNILPLVYNINYLANIPMYGGVEDLADTLASVRSLKKGISQKKCNEDAIALSVKTCAFISTKKFPLILNNEIKDRRMRIMEEEIRMNIFAFIELCTDQASVPTEIFKYRTQQMCVHTSYARSLSSYNHPVPKFWN